MQQNCISQFPILRNRHISKNLHDLFGKFPEGKYHPNLELRVLICVAEDARKKVPSSVGMRRGVETSELLRFRAEQIVPKRADEMSAAIAERDFEKFAQITMKDSNQGRSE